jgi:Cdc6-like AAA superfamily ATPase
MFIGDGAKLVRDCFALAKEKAPAIIFIDELDAIGTKRFDSEKSGDREVQRTMLELLNQLDGFASDDRIKVIAATNRVDVLDPALLRSGRLDRKIEFPLPNEEARAQILKIHSRKMKVDGAINWSELARSTDEFGGAMLKAVCVEAGMIALRMGKNKIGHEHYVDAISEVQAKKKDVSSALTEQRVSVCDTDNSSRRSTSTLKSLNAHRIIRIISEFGRSTLNLVRRYLCLGLIERAGCVIRWAISLPLVSETLACRFCCARAPCVPCWVSSNSSQIVSIQASPLRRPRRHSSL